MEKEFEYLEAWMKAQKEYLDTWSKSQKEFMNNWSESLKTFQGSFEKFGGTQEGASKDIGNFFNSILNNMTNSAKFFGDEMIKVQETWKSSLEKQMEASKEMIKNFSQFLKQTADKKEKRA
jgi:hypothetical protein